MEGLLNARVSIAGHVVAGLALALAACGRGGAPASGHARPDEVALVVGEGVAPAAADILEKALRREVTYGTPEPLFHVKRVAAADLGRVRRARSILLLANMGVPGFVARAAREILSAREAGEAGAGSSAFYLKKDVWGPGQSVLVVPGQDARDVLSLVESRSEKIREALLTASRERVARDLFRDGEDKNAMNDLAGAVGWSVRIPMKGWRLDRAREGDGLVRIEGDRPPRALTVAWAPADSSRLAAEGAFDHLDAIAARHGRGGAVDRESASALLGRFAGKSALVTRGVRRGAPGDAGTPFEAALFLGGAPERLYVVEREVARTAEEGGAKVAMWELDAIAATFQLAGKVHAAPE